MLLTAAPSWDALHGSPKPVTNASRDDCVEAPTRACLLDEALIAALSTEPSDDSATQLQKIAEAQTARKRHGRLSDRAFDPARPQARANAMVAIAGAQVRRGVADDAKETLVQGRRLTDGPDRAFALAAIAAALPD
jgi:hypothetical protein